MEPSGNLNPDAGFQESARNSDISLGLLRKMIRRLRNYAWDGRYLLRAAFDVLRWPFERAVWALERGVVWPLRERTSGWSSPVRSVAVASVALLAAGALAFGAIRAGDSGETAPIVAAPVSAPVKATAPAPPAEPAEPVLRGPAPDFSPAEADEAKAKATDADTVISSDPDTTAGAGATVTSSAATASSSDATTEKQDPGPAAIDVARRFSGAFVLYETGNANAKVRKAFAATATPQLTKALLRRPPRLPANVEVPKAKVLNVVPGPRTGDTFTLSASLLRVGVTSELRIDVHREQASGEWRVTDVLG